MNALQRIFILRRIVRRVCYVRPFDALRFAKMQWDAQSEHELETAQTISTNKRSSRIKASCISNGTRSNVSCLPFPFAFDVGLLVPTREFRGALTNDASAMNEGSSLSQPNRSQKVMYPWVDKRSKHLFQNYPSRTEPRIQPPRRSLRTVCLYAQTRS